MKTQHKWLDQGCANFITEGPNAIKQIKPWAAPSFHAGCLVLVTGIKIHFVVLNLVRGPQVAYPWVRFSTKSQHMLSDKLLQFAMAV